MTYKYYGLDFISSLFWEIEVTGINKIKLNFKKGKIRKFIWNTFFVKHQVHMFNTNKKPLWGRKKNLTL